MRDVNRRTKRSAGRQRGSYTASPSLIAPAYGIGNGLIGDGAEPDESEPPQSNSVAYAALSDSIAVISSRHEVSCIIPIHGHPRDLTIDDDGSRLYATDYGGSVSVIDMADHRVGVIPGTCCVHQVDTVDGALIYAAGNAVDGDRRGGRISVIDAGGATVAVIAGLDGYSITDLAVDPEGNRVYAGLSRQSARFAGVCGQSVLTVGDRHGCQRSAVGDLPRCVRISPDGKGAYVSNFGDGSVSVIDTIAQCVTDTIDVGGHPEALG
jgi:YVTN family beta-propeller protein